MYPQLPETAPSDHRVTLRPAREADLGILQEIYSSTRTEEIERIPWRHEEKHAFMRHQFNAQHLHYLGAYPDAEFCILESEGQVIGRLYVHRSLGELRIVDITLLPQWRGQGIGTSLLQTLLREAESRGDVVTLHVDQESPAKRLYSRLGFHSLSENEFYTLMRWSGLVGI